MLTCADLTSRSLSLDGCASVSAFTRCTQRCRSSLSIEYDQDGCREEPSKQCEVREVSGGCMQNSPYYLDWEKANDGTASGTRILKCNRGTDYIGEQPRQRNFDDLRKQCDHVSAVDNDHVRAVDNPCLDDTSSLENSKYCVPGRPGFNFSFILNNTRCFEDTPGWCDSVGRNYPQNETECYTNPGDNDGNQFLCYYSGGSRGHETYGLAYETYDTLIDTEISYGEERFNAYTTAESVRFVLRSCARRKPLFIRNVWPRGRLLRHDRKRGLCSAFAFASASTAFSAFTTLSASTTATELERRLDSWGHSWCQFGCCRIDPGGPVA